MVATPKVLGSFGKGLDGSISLNFGLSGGRNCDVACRLHPDNPSEIGDKCYAAKLERRADRIQLKNKLARHGERPLWSICGQAILELQSMIDSGKAIPWIRLSTNGSLPKPEDFTALDRAQLRAFVALAQTVAPVHIPVESVEKARFYRAILPDVCIRESAQGMERFLSADGAVSVVVGEIGTKYRERLELAAQAARERRELTGRKTITCPAIANHFVSWGKGNRHKKNDRAKCGACVACADPLIDIVYPIH